MPMPTPAPRQANRRLQADPSVEKELCLPLPEMTFGNNSLALTFEGGVHIAFDAISALREVAVGDGWEERVGGGVLVSMAESWSKR